MRVDVEKENRQRELMLNSFGCLVRIGILFIFWVAVLYATFWFAAAHLF